MSKEDDNLPVPKSRRRTRRKTVVSGSRTLLPELQHLYPEPHVISYGPLEIRYQVTDDFHLKGRRADGTYPPSQFRTRIWERGDFLVQGQSGPYRVNYRVRSRDAVSVPSSEFSHRPSNTEFVTQLLSETTPFRSVLSIPELIKDLVEYTTLLRINVKNAATASGSTFLNLKFGWGLLLKDVATLNNAADLIQSRMKEFDSLYKHGGLRRNVKLWQASASAEDESDTSLASGPFVSVHGRRKSRATHTVWGSVRWKPRCGIDINHDEFRSAMFSLRQVFDLEPLDWSTAWNLIPFSWVIDYFTNIGEIFASLEGEEFVVPYDICIMEKKVTTGGYLSYENNFEQVVKAGRLPVYTDKRRYVESVSPTLLEQVHSRFPTDNQLVTLAALIALLLGNRA